MTEMVLLGAGASVHAGIPHSFAMTGEIASRFAADPHSRVKSHLIRFVIGGLLLQKGIRDEDPFSGVDVEELFNAVLLLGERNTLEAAPFVGSWHSMVERFDRAAPSSRLFQRLNRLIYENVTDEIIRAFPNRSPSFGGKDIDRSLETVIQKSVEAMAKNRRPSISSFNGVGRAVGDYIVKLTDQWLSRLRNKHPRGATELQEEFSKVVEQFSRSGEGRVFRRTAEAMIQVLAQIVWIESPDRVEYLNPLLRLLSRQSSLVVGSVNYDNSVELIAEAAEVPCTTGIENWSETGDFPIEAEGLTLLKLHGSIDWALKVGESSQTRPMPHSIIEKVPPEEIKKRGYRPAVIFGQRNKLTAEGPFLDILRTFHRALDDAERLTVVGYSFRDPHINEYISQWLNGDATRRMRIVDPGFASSRIEFAASLRRHCESMLEVISEKAEVALPSVFPN